MNELTWEQEQDIHEYNIWLAESQVKQHYARDIQAGDRVKHVQGIGPEGVVKRVYQPVGAVELWADVLWFGSKLRNLAGPTNLRRDRVKSIRLSALKLA